ncbi:pectate lyase [Aestuariibaculum sp. M13]|uniref:pectate lyase n=1 Tax=Aestuariibaculum sp. M13 TaxID=2967132 RepID=UPI002159CBDE|nr:pectate lyase [Aestuariibaculum sp. M13]MCR8666777.1 pectate lyase [Aestuariibaculum sp. M13]
MKILKQITLALIFVLTFEALAFSQVHDPSWRRIIYQSEDNWFATEEAKTIAENVLLYQRAIGGWPKNTQMQNPLSSREKAQLKSLKNSNIEATTDNGATTQELYFLSKMYQATANENYKQAFLKGVDYLLEAQYDNGGWPQFYPLKKGYYTHITYNDNSMVNILKVLQDLKDNTGKYAIQLPKEKFEEVEKAFNMGIECILKTQYKQNGVLTVWCAQHDEKTLQPAKARSYELPSLSGAESANIVLLLMSLKNPSPEVINAIDSAVAWFEKTKIEGVKIKREIDKETGKRNTVVVPDENGYPLWARFSELDDNTPFFSDRDGIKKAHLADIGEERRNGYAWYSTDPNLVLKRYPEWKAKYNTPKKKQEPKDPYNMVVAKDGTGDFTTIQEAMYAAKSFPYERVVINVKNGVYNEKVYIYSWNTHVSLIGESKEGTIITFDDYFKKIDLGRNSTFHTSTLLVEGDDFIAKNLTVKNTAGAVGQAIALSVNANRCYFENCAFIGNQDTVYTAGEGFKQYFKNCYIEGTTDFIFGEATVLFENCQIHNKSNSYITAASTPQSQEYGYVFKNCNLTADKNVTDVYLGRPWRFYAKTVYIECQMGKHIKPEGWHNWKKAEAEKFSFYAEYNCFGEGYKPESRVPWSHQLKKSQAKKYTKENILKSTTKWYQNL